MHPNIDNTDLHTTLTIGIVAGEISGDSLGADFMAQMNAIHPNITWVGVGGDKMTKQGLNSLIDMSRLSVMGLVEVAKHLPDLLSAKREILQAFFAQKIDIFVGIDAPDFNLRLGKLLKKQGIFCVQYVSPSIWAWRENRIHTIKQATDLVLCLFPFELPVYQKHRHPAVCVGHPLLASLKIPNHINELRSNLRHNFGLATHQPVICLMAGSRTGEITAILPILLASFDKILRQFLDCHALLPLAKDEQTPLIASLIDKNTPHLAKKLHILTPSTPMDFLDDISKNNLKNNHLDNTQSENTLSNHQPLNQNTLSISQLIMAVSDLTILASGTATLEASLLYAPMVVVYKVNTATFMIAKKLVKIDYVSLPNILSSHQTGKAIVPELIQDNATADNISNHAIKLLKEPDSQKQALIQLVETLKNDSRQNPALAVLHDYQQNKR